MPKTKRKTVRAQQAAAQTSSTQPVKTWVKWVALGIVAALGVSIIAGAITATPAHASTTAAYGETGTCLLDTDNDGIDNSQDGDPASTNCNSDAPPPIMAYSTAPVSTEDKATLGLWVTFGSAFAVIALLVIVLLSRRTKKG